MALPNVPHQTARVNSGDVSIFYRVLGARGRTPIVIMHGANYFDSYDWIGVAGVLASDRQVVAFDRRGWGESTWSPSKDYSIDAHVSDARNRREWLAAVDSQAARHRHGRPDSQHYIVDVGIGNGYCHEYRGLQYRRPVGRIR